MNPTKKFRTTFSWLYLMMQLHHSTSWQRFQQMKEFQKNFGFLFEIVHTRSMIDANKLKASCLNLQTALSSHAQSDSSDIDGIGIPLFDELRALQNGKIIPESVNSVLELIVRFLLIIFMRFSQLFLLFYVSC